MPVPNLLNPTDVELRLLDKNQTRFSNSARESKGKTIYATAITMPCQPFIGVVEQAETDAAGIEEKATGYIVVREKDMNAMLSRALERGDKIVSFGSGSNKKTVEFFILGHKLGAAYTVTNGFSLRKYYFSNRVVESPGSNI